MPRLMGSLNEHVHNWLRRSAVIDIESTKSVLKKGNALICSFSSSLFGIFDFVAVEFLTDDAELRVY